MEKETVLKVTYVDYVGGGNQRTDVLHGSRSDVLLEQFDERYDLAIDPSLTDAQVVAAAARNGWNVEFVY